MSTYKMTCPGCGRKVEGDPALAGSDVVCPSCSRQFKAPTLLKPASPEYAGNVESPFKSFLAVSDAPVKKKPRPTPARQIKLVLRGVLLRSQPLALLEDETGKTYICGVNEKMPGAVILKIEQDRVTLRNKQGPFMISVKE